MKKLFLISLILLSNLFSEDLSRVTQKNLAKTMNNTFMAISSEVSKALTKEAIKKMMGKTKNGKTELNKLFTSAKTGAIKGFSKALNKIILYKRNRQ